MSLNKVMTYKGVDPEKPRILLLAPTGVAVAHINGTWNMDIQSNGYYRSYW